MGGSQIMVLPCSLNELVANYCDMIVLASKLPAAENNKHRTIQFEPSSNVPEFKFTSQAFMLHQVMFTKSQYGLAQFLNQKQLLPVPQQFQQQQQQQQQQANSNNSNIPMVIQVCSTDTVLQLNYHYNYHNSQRSVSQICRRYESSGGNKPQQQQQQQQAPESNNNNSALILEGASVFDDGKIPVGTYCILFLNVHYNKIDPSATEALEYSEAMYNATIPLPLNTTQFPSLPQTPAQPLLTSIKQQFHDTCATIIETVEQAIAATRIKSDFPNPLLMQGGPPPNFDMPQQQQQQQQQHPNNNN